MGHNLKTCSSSLICSPRLRGGKGWNRRRGELLWLLLLPAAVGLAGTMSDIQSNEPGRFVHQNCFYENGGGLLCGNGDGALMQTWLHGTGVTLFMESGATAAHADIYIDDAFMGRVSVAASALPATAAVYTAQALRRTSHRVRIVQVGATPVKLDYIRVFDDSTVNLSAPDADALLDPLMVAPPNAALFAGVDILQSNAAPRALHFRRSEADALRLAPDYAAWESRYGTLGGVIGKMYNEDEIQLEGPEGNFPQRDIFRTFKQNHPEKLVLLHFDGKYRNIRTERADLYAPQHFLYYVRQSAYSDLSAADGQSVVRTVAPVYKYFRSAQYNYQNEDVVLVGKAPDGSVDWSAYEYTTLAGYADGNDPFGDGIVVERGRYGSARRSWTAGDYYLLVPVSTSPWDIETNNHWSYNFSINCPTNNNGETCADLFSDEIAAILTQTNEWSIPEFDGVEFDIMQSSLDWIGFGRTRGIDTDQDGVADFGPGAEVNEINLYGTGTYRLAALLRQKLGPGRIIMGDSGQDRGQRGFGLFNGMEQESWMHDWSTSINRLRFWMQHAYAPAFSYVNWKFVDGDIWYEPDPNITRLYFASVAVFDVATAFYSYRSLGDPTKIHDEAICGADGIAGWLGAPLAGPVCLAKDGVDLLGNGGVEVSTNFLGRIQVQGDDSVAERVVGDRPALQVGSASDGRVMFRISDIDLSSVANRELTLMTEVYSEKSGVLPSGMQRLFLVRVLDQAGRVLEEQNMFAANGSYMSNIIFLQNLGTADVVDIEFDFEGCGTVRLRNTGLFAAAPVLLRKFENGIVLANPSHYPYSLQLNKAYRHLLDAYTIDEDLHNRRPDAWHPGVDSLAYWKNEALNLVVAEGALRTTASASQQSTWLELPEILAGDVFRASAVVVANGDANNDWLSFGLLPSKDHAYQSAAPYVTLTRRPADADLGANLGFLNVYGGSGGSNQLAEKNWLKEAQGFSTNLNARNSLGFEYDTATGNLAVWLTSEGGNTVTQYNGSVNYGGVPGQAVPLDQLNYFGITFNSLNAQNDGNPAYLDDLKVARAGTVLFEDGFETISYGQPVNNGSFASATLELPPQDGLFLLATDPDIDQDGDGISDEWERDRFRVLATASQHTDYDADGFPDLFECKAGTDPADPLSLLRVDTFNVHNDGSFFIRWPSSPGHHYRVMSASELSEAFSPLATAIPATPPMNTYTQPVDVGPKRFFRIEVE